MQTNSSSIVNYHYKKSSQTDLLKSDAKKIGDRIMKSNKINVSVLERKSLDIMNPKGLCNDLEKEFKEKGIHQNSLIQNISIKHLIVRDNKEIIGPISTLNNEQIDQEQYEKLKKKNKLLEYIIVNKCIILVEEI